MSADERERTRNNIAFTRQSMQQVEQERTARHAAGRYTLLEAAGFIARATHTNTDTVLGKMHREAESHGLPVYMPSASNACTWPNEDYGDLCHVLAVDLNRFIDKYHPGDFHFPEPTTVSPDEPGTAVEPAEAVTKARVVLHLTRSKRATPLSVEIAKAKENAGNNGDNTQSIWDELVKLAEARYGALVGYSSDGVQFRGKVYQETGTPDVFTLKNLRDRAGGARRRAAKRDKAR
jgi:hypothetical protein